MDEQFIQEVKAVSHEIVEKDFPEEEEYFDFLFDLIMPELQELEPGKEPEFLREIRAVHPLALGYTAVVITIVYQTLVEYVYRDINIKDTIKKKRATEEKIKGIIAGIVKDEDEQENFSRIPKVLMEYIKKAKIKAKTKD